jgi:hypothetical protein
MEDSSSTISFFVKQIIWIFQTHENFNSGIIGLGSSKQVLNEEKTKIKEQWLWALLKV